MTYHFVRLHLFINIYFWLARRFKRSNQKNKDSIHTKTVDIEIWEFKIFSENESYVEAIAKTSIVSSAKNNSEPGAFRGRLRATEQKTEQRGDL